MVILDNVNGYILYWNGKYVLRTPSSEFVINTADAEVYIDRFSNQEKLNSLKDMRVEN